MCIPSSVRRVLGQEVEPERGQGCVGTPAVDPDELELADAHEVGVAPELRQEEAAQPQDPVVADSNRFVKRVRSMTEAGTTQ